MLWEGIDSHFSDIETGKLFLESVSLDQKVQEISTAFVRENLEYCYGSVCEVLGSAITTH